MSTDAANAADTPQRVLAESREQFLSFLERRLGRRDLAEDVLQEALARALSKLDTLRSDEAVLPWFYRTLRNAVIDYQRRTQSAHRALTEFAHELESSHEPAELRGQVCRCVSRLAGALKPEYRDALQRVEVEGTPLADFAEQTGISANNARVRVFRARDALKKRVSDCCGACAERGCFECTCA